MSQLEDNSFQSKREKILHFLLINQSPSKESCTLKDIASAMRLSTTGIRHYLNILENEGLITRREKQGSTGRPAMAYSLTDEGYNTFPKAYTEFSVNLLEEMKKKIGEDETIDILERIGKKSANRVLRKIINHGKIEDSMKQKLKHIVNVFHEYGKYPELLEDDSSYLVKTYNCLFYDIVKEEPLVCKVTETMMAELTGNLAKKEKCIIEGDECCLFRIMKDS